MDARKNFALGTVATPPSPAASGTSLILDAGQGARFPNPSGDGAFNAVVWPADAVPLASNAEVIRVTARATDTFSTILRQQEGSSARTIVAGDQVALCATDKVFDDIETLIAGAASDLATHAADTTAIHGIANTALLETSTGAQAKADAAFTAAVAASDPSGAAAAAQAASQPADADLTAIAALATAAFGRSVLTKADAAALRTLAGLVLGTDVQAWDADLDALAALAPSNDDVLQRKAGAWTNRSIAQLLVDLGLADVGYQTFNTDVAISATTEAGANTVVTLPSFTPNGTDAYEIEFYCPGVQIGSVAAASCLLSLFDNGSVYGGGNAVFAQWANPAAAAFITPGGTAKTPKFTPSNAAHVYSVRGWRAGANASVRGTAGGVSLAGWVRIRKAL